MHGELRADPARGGRTRRPSGVIVCLTTSKCEETDDDADALDGPAIPADLGFGRLVDAQAIEISRSRVCVCPKTTLPFQSRVTQVETMFGGVIAESPTSCEAPNE